MVGLDVIDGVDDGEHVTLADAVVAHGRVAGAGRVVHAQLLHRLVCNNTHWRYDVMRMDTVTSCGGSSAAPHMDNIHLRIFSQLPWFVIKHCFNWKQHV